MGAHLRGLGRGQKEPVSDDRLDDRPRTPAGGHRPQKRGDKALGRSRGGLTTKIHLLADEAGLPVAFRITAGQVNDCTQAELLLKGRAAEAVLADRGYDTNAILALIEATGAEAVIPSCRHRRVQREHNRTLYAQRNRIERCFSKLKQLRRFSTRYCKTTEAFRAFTALACAWIRLQLYVDTP